jgi:hypothetical protein
MSINKLSLNKMADMLVKAMEHKEHFDKKAKDKEIKLITPDYIKKVQILKEVLTQEYKLAIVRNSSNKPVVEKHIEYIKKLHSRGSIDKSDQEIIDRLINKYGY